MQFIYATSSKKIPIKFRCQNKRVCSKICVIKID